MNNRVISVNSVSKSYAGNKAVDCLSFSAHSSSCLGLLGPNGAGKTTMMKMIYGKCDRDKQNGGIINVFGHDPRASSLDIKYLSGVVPQEDNLDTQINVFNNLYIYSKFYGMSRKDAIPRIDYLLEFLEMSDKRKATIKSLSGGMKRRLVIARALLHSPRLLILDEPTTGLDPQVRHLIWEKLHLLKKEGITILLSTHYMEEAFQLCDTILIMNKGNKILEGPPKQLLKSNMERFVLEPQKPIEHQFLKKLPLASIRVDKTRTLPLFYSDSYDSLKQLTDRLGHSEYLLRQSSLEDLFLNITGRDLNGNQ